MRRAIVAGADAVVLDLEDAVANAVKGDARVEVAALLEERVVEGQVLSEARTDAPDIHVRVNRQGPAYDPRDLDAIVRPGLQAIRLPKAESPEAIVAVANALAERERAAGLPVGSIGLYPTIESAAGAVRIAELAVASQRVVRFALGTADLLADLGAHGDDDLATLHIRSQLVLHSRAAGIGPPVDSVFTNLDDPGGLRRQAVRARALGFHGKSVIHPRQLGPVHEVFTPSEDDVAHAERVLAALDGADADHRGAIAVDGTFVDTAVARRARAVLRLRSSS